MFEIRADEAGELYRMALAYAEDEGQLPADLPALMELVASVAPNSMLVRNQAKNWLLVSGWRNQDSGKGPLPLIVERPDASVKRWVIIFLSGDVHFETNREVVVALVEAPWIMAEASSASLALIEDMKARVYVTDWRGVRSDALGGAPGVESSSFTQGQVTDQENQSGE